MKTKSKIAISVLVGILGLAVLFSFGETSKIKATEVNSERSIRSAAPKATSEPIWGSGVSVGTMKQLSDALTTADVNHITLTNNITLDGNYTISKDLFIEGNGFSIISDTSAAAGNSYGFTLGSVSKASYLKLVNLSLGRTINTVENGSTAFFTSADTTTDSLWSIDGSSLTTIANNQKPLINTSNANIAIANSSISGRVSGLSLIKGGEVSFQGDNKLAGTTGTNNHVTANKINATGSLNYSGTGAFAFWALDSGALENLKIIPQSSAIGLLYSKNSPTVTNLEVAASNSNLLGIVVNSPSDYVVDGFKLVGQSYVETDKTKGTVSLSGGSLFQYNQNLTIKNSLISLNGTGDALYKSNYTNPSITADDPSNEDNYKQGNSITMDNTALYLTTSTFFNNIKRVYITNDSDIQATNTNAFYSSTVNYSELEINNRSNVELATPTTATYNTFTMTGNYSRFVVTGDETLKTRENNTNVNLTSYSNASADSGGVINFDTGVRGKPVYLNFSNYATVNILSARETTATPAVMLQSSNAEFNVTNNSDVTFESRGQSSSLGATLRFRYADHGLFNVSGNSIMRITKTQGTQAAVRMNGPGNTISVNDGGKLYVNQKTSATSSSSNYSAINYVSVGMGSAGNDSQVFNVTGKNSLVKLKSASGPAILAEMNLEVNANNNSFFEAIGKPANSGSIFSTSGFMNFKMDNPLYYDFRNNNNPTTASANPLLNAATSSALNSQSYFTSLNSDVSFWNKGVDLDGNPSYDRSFVNYSLTGGAFTLAQAGSPDADFSTKFGIGKSVNQYSRLSANNSAPNVDTIRQATTADKSLYIFGEVMEGFDDNGIRTTRPYWDNEVQMVVEIKEPGKDAYTKKGSSVKGPTTIYNDSNQEGYVKINLDDYLPAGTTVTVKQAWRGTADSNPDERPNTPDDELNQVPTMSVVDVSPPKLAVIASGKVSTSTKTISGNNATPGSLVYYGIGDAGANNQTLKNSGSVVAEDGSWSFDLPEYLTEGQEFSVYMVNPVGKISDTEISDIAKASNIETGNINPYNSITYHDATFEGVTKYIVGQGVIQDATVEKSLSFDTEKIGVGSVITYTIKISNDSPANSGIGWKNVSVTDVLDDGLDYDSNSADVQINGNSITTATYDSDSRKLTIPVGDVSPKSATGENIMTVTFKVTVNNKKIKQTISNQANASGQNDRAEVFEKDSNTVTTETILDPKLTVNFKTIDGDVLSNPIVIQSTVGSQVDLESNEDVQKNIDKILASDYILSEKPNPTKITISGEGDSATYIFDGILKIKSAPTLIDFGSLKVSSHIQSVYDPSVNGDLIVSDTRSSQSQGWQLTAKITKPMTNTASGIVMPNALKYNSNNGLDSKFLDDSDTIIDQRNTKGSVNISSSWGTTDQSNGIKLRYNPASISSGNSLGDYTGTIQWTLSEVPDL